MKFNNFILIHLRRSEIGRVRDFFVNNPIVIFLLWALWLTLEYFGLGPFSYIHVHDLWDSYVPARLCIIQEFSKNGFSYWYPYVACGIDRLPLEWNYFQVDNLLFSFFPGWFSYGFATVIQRFIAGYFTYRLCKDYLKLDHLPSIVAGLAYAISFSPSLFGCPWHASLTKQFAGVMGFPFILWSLEYITKKERSYINRYLLAFLLGLFALFSSSFSTDMVFTLPMVLVWFIFVRQNYSLRFFSVYSIYTAVILIGYVPVILALITNAPLSHRAYWPTFNPLSHGYEQVLVARLVYISSSVVYWGIGILGLLWIKFKDRRFLIIMLLFVVCGVGLPLVQSFFLDNC